MQKNIIPVKYMDDALHIAAAIVNGLDCIISYDREHIVKPKTMVGVGFINWYAGYKWLGAATPTEVIEYDP